MRRERECPLSKPDFIILSRREACVTIIKTFVGLVTLTSVSVGCETGESGKHLRLCREECRKYENERMDTITKWCYALLGLTLALGPFCAIAWIIIFWYFDRCDKEHEKYKGLCSSQPPCDR